MSPALSVRARRKRPRWAQFLGDGNGETALQLVLSEPVLRRLSDSGAALVEAADLFNASLFRRTIEGVTRALGAPLVSIVPLREDPMLLPGEIDKGDGFFPLACQIPLTLRLGLHDPFVCTE